MFCKPQGVIKSLTCMKSLQSEILQVENITETFFTKVSGVCPGPS